MMNTLHLLKFEHDPRLLRAYPTYEAVLDTFVKTFKRQPNCDLCVGVGGERPANYSIITTHWNLGNEDARKDAEQLKMIADIIQEA